jgi:hypothetical protein
MIVGKFRLIFKFLFGGISSHSDIGLGPTLLGFDCPLFYRWFSFHSEFVFGVRLRFFGRRH